MIAKATIGIEKSLAIEVIRYGSPIIRITRQLPKNSPYTNGRKEWPLGLLVL